MSFKPRRCACAEQGRHHRPKLHCIALHYHCFIRACIRWFNLDSETCDSRHMLDIGEVENAGWADMH